MRFSQRSLNNLEGVHPDLVRVMHEAIKETPIDFTIVEGLRTDVRQQDLYAQGRTKPGTIVTQVDGVNKKSNHQPKADGYGYAVDLYPYFGGSVRLRNVTYQQRQIADHIKKVANAMGVKIAWGGDWKSPYDPPHFELKE